MTDPAGAGTPPQTPSAPTPPLPDVGALVRAGEWRRALATARVTRADAHVEAALGAVVGVQEAVRARRSPAARRALVELRDALAHGSAAELAAVRHHADPDVLEAALDALDARERTDPLDEAALEDALAPALAAPLTRAEALNALGVRASALGDAARAEARFTEALGSDPGHYRALTNLGNLRLEAGDAVAAEARYREALTLNPDYDGAHHNLGVALRRQGRVAEAVSAIRRGQRLSLRRTQDDTRAEMREQFAASPALRWLRVALVVAVVVVVVLAVRGMGR